MAGVGLMPWRRRSLLLLASLLRLGLALYEDEVGQYEWLIQQIGEPTSLAYSPDVLERVFVASQAGVVASILLKDGSLQWRRVAAPEGQMRLVSAGKLGRGSLISISDSGLVQAWKSATGDLTWQQEYPDKVIEVIPTKQSVLVVRSTEIDGLSQAGRQEWSLASEDSEIVAAAMTDSENTVCVLGLNQKATEVSSKRIDISTGVAQLASTKKLDSDLVPALVAGSYIAMGPYLVTLAGSTLSLYSLCGSDLAPGSATFDISSKVKSSGTSQFSLLPWQQTAGVFAVTNGATTAILGATERGLKLLRTFDGVAVVGPVVTVHDDETGPVAVVVMKEEGAQIQLLDPASGNVQPAIVAEGYKSKDHGQARLFLVRELSSGEHRTVLSASDFSLAGLQGKKLTWVREEALATVQQAVFVARHATVGQEVREIPGLAAQLAELPARLGDIAYVYEEMRSEFVSWVQSLISGKKGHKAPTNLLPSSKVPTSAEELRGFGADKLILVTTRAMKIFALEATTSEIIWQEYLGMGVEGEAESPLKMQLLPTGSDPHCQLLVIMPKSKMSAASQDLLWLDPLTGGEVHRERLQVGTGASILSVTALPPKTAKDQVLPVVVIDSSHQIYGFPKSSQEVLNVIEGKSDKYFHYHIDRAANAVKGYAIGKALTPLWNLDLALLGERIIASTSLEHREWDHVPVHIKGDASILYKYINSNLLVVVSQDSGSVSSGRSSTASAGAPSSALNLYTLDAVTGHVLHQSRINNGSGPVQLVACDNWVVMHYWNLQRVRFEMTVVELFESKSDDGPWDLLFGDAKNISRSAHHVDIPTPLQQSYIVPAGVTALGVTATLKGITPRSVIMAMTTDHIFRVSKDILNPRRPLPDGESSKGGKILPEFAPTKDEGVIPYQAIIPLRPMDVLSYYNPVGRVHGIVSTPTALESTSLVFCHGLDLFMSPVQSAKAYDVLSPGFNYNFLYASVGTVIVLVLVTWYVAQIKALQDKWK